MDHEKKLIKNTSIYAIGNIGSKILAYVAVLIYSHYIEPASLGLYDVVLTSVSFIVPIVTMEIHEALYRFVVDSQKEDHPVFIATTLKYLLLATGIAEIIFCILGGSRLKDYVVGIVLYSASYVVYSCMQMVVRGKSKTTLYSAIGVTNAFVTLVLELVGIVALGKGINSLFFAMGIANTICIAVIIIKTDLVNEIISTRADINVLKQMLIFSVPLVPTTISWWIVNFCDRYIILLKLGQEYNGIYALACRFPIILNTIANVFYMAWQESAIKLYKSSDRDQFYSKVFDRFYILLTSCCAMSIPAIKLIIILFVDKRYATSWMYVGPLMMGSVFMALSSFLGVGYLISNDTIRSTGTSVVAAITNVLINVLLVERIGLQAAAISTLIAYTVLFALRAFDTKRYFEIRYNKVKMAAFTFLCLAVIALVLFIDSTIILSLMMVVCGIIAICSNGWVLKYIKERTHDK